jgi:dolichol-phosphate mannosyltransferase
VFVLDDISKALPLTNGAATRLDSVPTTALPRLTVIVPTRDEAENVEPLLDRVIAAAGGASIEVLFVDDSDDDTPAVVQTRMGTDPVPVRLLHRAAGERHGGLGGAVVAGLRAARGDWAVVMDGDLQHPPELALLLADVGRARELDLVVATRHTGSGDAAGLTSAARHAASGSATAAAKTLFPVRLSRLSDPMSGLFAVRPAALDLDRMAPSGFKILLEIAIRHPRLRTAEVPFSLQPRLAGQSKASLREGARFLRQLVRLRAGVLAGQVARSAGAGPRRWLLRSLLFGLVGLTGLVVNTAVLWLESTRLPGLHYLIAAAVATQASTAWLFLLTEKLVFRGAKPGTARSRAVRFFLLNNVALLARLPVLALLVEVLGLGVLPANILTLVLLFVVRFLIADSAIYATSEAAPAREPMRIVVEVPQPEPRTDRSARRSAPDQRYLPFRYAIPGVATIGSQVCLRELEYFRAQYLDHDTDIQVRVGRTGGARPRGRAMMTQTASPDGLRYAEHLGWLGANFDVQLGEPITVTVAPPLAHSPHVVYTNILEALLRFVAISRGAMLLHSACIELDGVGMLISAETDTGKTGTVLRMVRELGARFLSDDMTVLHPDGRAGCFPKPLTISAHTLRAIQSSELSRAEWRRLQVQSRLHSKEGRQFAMQLSRLNIPIMGVNALTQRVVPPPKYTIDRLLPCAIAPEVSVSELFIISRGAFDAGDLDRADAMRTLMANTEDAYQFPPFKQLAPSVVIGGVDHAELRRREQAILASALGRIRCRYIATPDFSWADEIATVQGVQPPVTVDRMTPAGR